jgi:RimJ/RimL family protein N-acetyltransferase
MQRSWRNDPDKLTFIACAPHTTNLQNCGEQELPEMLLGDVNLFLTTPENPGIIVGEIELMIAVKNLQGHGYGRATLLAFLKYVVQHEKDLIDEFSKDRMDVEGEEGIQELVAKIGEGNIRSIGLFESVGFQKVGEEVNYFGEWELRLGEGWRDVVRALGFENYREVEYMANGGD